MAIFDNKDFERLSEVHEPHCISIFIPTHRGAEGGEGLYKDKTALKNELKEVEQQLKLFELSSSESDRYLQTIEDLLQKEEMWKHLSDCLAIFYDGKKLEFHTLPVKIKEGISYVNNHFYLKPLAEWVNSNQAYYLLSLSLGEVKLYEADQTSLYNIEVDDLIPVKMTEVVGADYEEKHLQRRSEQGESGDAEGIYHGQGMSNDNVKKEEALKFFHEVDKGLNDYLHDKQKPLMLVGVDYLKAIYKESNSYPHILEEHLKGSPKDYSLDELHDASWKIIDKQLKAKKENEKSKFEGLLSQGKADSSIDKIIPAAVAGRVDKLFLLKDEQIWGKYDQELHQIQKNEVRSNTDTDLLNLAAIKTVNQGGKVFLIDDENEMPSSSSSANAIFRYSRAS